MRILAVKLAMLAISASCSAVAQNNELGILEGCESRPLFDNCGWTTQITYAWQFLDTRSGSLYLEFPVLLNSTGVQKTVFSLPAGNAITGNQTAADIFFTPGIRYKFWARPRIALYSAAGFGAGWTTVVTPANGTKRNQTGAFDFVGGADFRLTRLLSLRGEVRNYVTRPRFGDEPGRVLTLYQIGLGFHF